MVACMTNMQKFLGFEQRKYQFWSIIVCMKSIQNVLCFFIKENSVWCIIVCMTKCRMFWVFRLKKFSLVYYCTHEKHAEFSRLPCMTNMQNVLDFYIKENSVWCIIVCMKNMQNFMGFHA